MYIFNHKITNIAMNFWIFYINIYILKKSIFYGKLLVKQLFVVSVVSYNNFDIFCNNYDIFKDIFIFIHKYYLNKL